MTPENIIEQWRKDPVQFVKDNFGVTPDAWQIEFLMAAVGNNRISATASKGVGKTASLSWLCWWFLVCFPKPNIAAVSTSIDNLRDGLWKEMSVWAGKSEIISKHFVITATKIYEKDHQLDWWMSARGYSKAADANQQADALAGLHAEYMMFIIDEAGTVPDAVGAAAEAAIGTEGGKKLFVIAGNTNRREGPLWRANSSEAGMWRNIVINGDPDSPTRSSRISRQWALDQIKTYGRDSAFVKVNVFGEFPQTSLDALLGESDVSGAINRRLDEALVAGSQKRIGVDVARFGDDRTVIIQRQGPLVSAPLIKRELRSNEVADIVFGLAQEWGADQIFVDDTGGYGSGVVDFLIQYGMNPIPVNFSSKPLNSVYFNRRAEMWFLMAEWVKRVGVLPEEHSLQKELTAPMFDYSNDKFKLEAKDDIKSRLGWSPDIADALALTFALPDVKAPKYSHPLIKGSNRVKTEWDPIT